MASLTALSRRHVPVWLIPMLWTLALGVWGLSRQDSVWRDEAATWNVAQRSTPEIWHLLGHVDVVHGCYYLLMHILFEWFGPGTTTLRLPSVMATAVAASCVTVIGQRLADVWTGVASGLAFGLLPAVQFYLQEGRPYALVAAGAGVSTLVLVTALQGRARTAHWGTYFGAVLICGLLNWLSLMILAAHLVTLAWSRAAREVWARWSVASVAAIICLSPLILFSHSQSAQVSWIPPLTWHMMIGPTVLVAIGGVGALLDRPRLGRLSLATVGLPLLAVPQIGLIGLSLIQPLFLDRYILFSLLGLALLVGSIIGSLVRAATPRFPRASVWLVPLMVMVATAALLPQSLAKRSPGSRVDDVLAIAVVVQEMKQAGSAVLFIPSARRDAKSVSPSAFVGLRDIALTETPEASGTLKGVEGSPQQIRAAILSQQRIMLLTDAPEAAKPVTAQRDKTKLSLLRQNFTAVADTQVRGRRLTVYERNPSAR